MTTARMRRQLPAGFVPCVLATAALLCGSPARVEAAAGDHWVATWSSSPMPPDALPDGENTGFANQTLREVAHVSIGGHRVRLRLSNAYGHEPLQLGAVHAALHAQGSAIIAGSDHPLTFNGRTSVAIPAGAQIISDAIDMELQPLADLAISIYLPAVTGPLTWHQLGNQTTYVSAPGDATAAPDLSAAATTTSLYLLSGVDVLAPASTGALVALGDSITDGYRSTLDAFHRWPDALARRLAPRSGLPAVAVLNQGISGNRLLHDVVGPNALARFDRDVLAQPGVTQVIVLERINDIGLPGWFKRPAEAVDAGDLIGALSQLIQRAHDRGIRIYGATVTPFENCGEPYFSTQGEAAREALNDWIRSQAPFDAVIDFDRVLRDPAQPTRLLPAFDSGDHLHPDDAGYAAMAAAVDLRLLSAPTRR